MATELQTKAFIDALEDAFYEPVAYSGRGMYGKECVSLKGDDLSLWDVARSLPEDMYVSEPRTDSLGLGIVIYWPQYEWPKGRE